MICSGARTRVPQNSGPACHGAAENTGALEPALCNEGKHRRSNGRRPARRGGLKTARKKQIQLFFKKTDKQKHGSSRQKHVMVCSSRYGKICLNIESFFLLSFVYIY